MVKVTELAYIGFSISDADAWRDFAASCVGMEILDDNEDDRFYLRMDHWHHRFVMQVGDEDDLAYLGWRVAGPRESEAMGQLLQPA